MPEQKRKPSRVKWRSKIIWSRIYNFPQDRVTDHRINQNFNQINLIMEGKLSPIIGALQKADAELKKKL